MNLMHQNQLTFSATWGFQPHFFTWKKLEKVYGKSGKSIRFPLFPYTFFPNEKNGVRPPTCMPYSKDCPKAAEKVISYQFKLI